MTRTGFFALLAAFTAASGPAFADSVSGTVLAFDRVAQLVVLDDKSVWSLKDGGTVAPDDLRAGDRVTIDFQTSGDNGYGKILGIAVAE